MSKAPPLETSVQGIRQLIFQAQAIINVTGAATDDGEVRLLAIRQSLDVAHEILERAATQLEHVATLVDAEVAHG